MTSLFLTEYVKFNMFIQDLNKEIANYDMNYDLLLSDINYTDCPIITVTPENKPKNSSLIDTRKDAISVSKRPLIILNELNLNFLNPLFNTINKKENITIINLYSGLWSYENKIKSETHDLDIISHTDFNCFEPIDLENLQWILKQQWKQYIRLLHKEIPEAIFNVDELWIIDSSILDNTNIISLKTYWFSWTDWVILSTWSLFNTAIQTWELLQDSNKHFNIFIFQKLNSKRTNEIVENVKKNKLLFILIDHDSKEIKEQIEKILNDLKLKDITLHIISPKYNNLTTILNEYQEEQTEFDPTLLTKRIISKL